MNGKLCSVSKKISKAAYEKWWKRLKQDETAYDEYKKKDSMKKKSIDNLLQVISWSFTMKRPSIEWGHTDSAKKRKE